MIGYVSGTLILANLNGDKDLDRKDGQRDICKLDRVQGVHCTYD